MDPRTLQQIGLEFAKTHLCICMGFFRDSTKDPQSSNLWQLRFLTQVLQSQVPTNALQTTGYELLGGNDVFFFSSKDGR